MMEGTPVASHSYMSAIKKAQSKAGIPLIICPKEGLGHRGTEIE